MKKLLFLLTILPFALSAASFDCDKAKTDIEKFICKDPKLSKLDDEMGKAYKQALDRATNKEALKKEQIAWLGFRDRLFALSKVSPYKRPYYYRSFPTTIEGLSRITKELYQNRLFYLTAKDDKFHIKYSADNQTCGYFAKLLNDDISKNGNLNVSRLKEFNWIEWKTLELKWGNEPSMVRISYFDINNDGKNNGVFVFQTWLHYRQLQRFIYVGEEEGRLIEQPNATNPIGTLYRQGINGYENGTAKNNSIERMYESFMKKTNYCNSPYKNNNTECYWGVHFPIVYPMLYSNQYYLAVFGMLDSGILVSPDIGENLDIMDTLGNIVALVKYNADNELGAFCELTRANPNSQKYLFWYNSIRHKLNKL